MPISKPVTSGGAGPRPPVDSFATKIPGYGGVPAQQAAIALDNATTANAAATTDVAKAGVDVARAEEQGAALQVPLAEEYSAGVNNYMAASKMRRDKIATEADRALGEATAKHYVNHWQDQSTGTKVLAAISSFLGGFATGTPVSRAQEWIDRDYQNQKDEMARLWKVAEARGADRDHLEALEESGLRHLQNGYLAKIEAAKRQVDYEVKKKGTAQAVANGQKLITDLDMAAAKVKEQQAKDLDIQAMSHTRKGLGQQNIRTTKTRDGQTLWKNPIDGLWHPLLHPAPTGAPPGAVLAAPSAAPPSPITAPASAVAPPTIAPAPPSAAAPGLAGFNAGEASQRLANVGMPARNLSGLGLATKTRISGHFPGMMAIGNVDLTNRPDVANADGTHSSVRSMSFEEGGQEVLVPTVSEDGRIMSDDEAIDQYHQTGRFLGKFKSPSAATAYAKKLHEQQESAGKKR